MADSMHDRLREAAAKLPPSDPKKAAAKRKEDHDAWEVEAIPKLFEDTPTIPTHDGGLDKPSKAQVVAYLRGLGQRLAFDTRSEQVIFDGKPVKEERIRTSYLRWASIGLDVPKETSRDAIDEVAMGNAFDPVVRYLDGLSGLDPISPFDVGRIYLGLDDEIQQAMVGKWLVAAVQRAYEPGSDMQYILTLMGAEALRKSWFLRALGGDHFSDSFRDPQSKDFLDWVKSSWLLECPEVDRELRKGDPSLMKRLLTIAIDKYRAPYARRPVDYPRRSVFAATTNCRELLNAEGGDRRWWIVECRQRVDVESLQRDRDRIWAGACEAYRAGEKPFFPPAIEAAISERNKDYAISLLFEDQLVPWLNQGGHNGFTVEHALVSAGCIYDTRELKKTERNEAVKVLERHGFERKRRKPPEGGLRCWRYWKD